MNIIGLFLLNTFTHILAILYDLGRERHSRHSVHVCCLLSLALKNSVFKVSSIKFETTSFLKICIYGLYRRMFSNICICCT